MSKLTEKLTKPEVQPKSLLMPSPQMETKKPQLHTRIWLVTDVLVLALIVIGVAALQASKSSQLTKTPTQAGHLRVGQAQPWYLAHDTHEPLTGGLSVQN